MFLGRIRLGLPIVAALLAVQGCNPSTLTPPLQLSTIEVATADPSSGSTSQSTDDCGHDYFPSEEDSTWEYAETNNMTGPDHSTYTLAESREDGFTMELKFSKGVTLRIEYACTDDGLIMLDPLQQFVGATAGGPDGSATLTTLAHSGLTMPAELNAASSWQQYVQWEARGSDDVLHGEYTWDFVAWGLEVTTVPFGTFDAMRVDTEIHGTLEGEDYGTCRTTTWYAKDVGMIKEDFSCDLLGSTIDNAKELESYDSP
jgi:hypothetical protein